MLILMPFGGVAADRMERRRILLVIQWVMAVLFRTPNLQHIGHSEVCINHQLVIRPGWSLRRVYESRTAQPTSLAGFGMKNALPRRNAAGRIALRQLTAS
jgi:hypothetical protein